MDAKNEKKIAMSISINSIIANIGLSVFKFVAGVFGHSEALISDAIHSASDVFSTFIVIIGVKISSKAPDKSHQYGHEKFESIAAMILAITLAATGIVIGLTGFNNIRSKTYLNMPTPTMITLIAALSSIIVKETMFWYTRGGAKKINSSALMADAWHHRSDALSSIGSLIGIIGARNGLPIFDPLASIVICIFILKAAVQIFIEGTNKIVDCALAQDETDKITKVILDTKGVLGIDSIKTRQFGNKAYVDVEISAYGNLTLLEAHDIAVEVHNKIEQNFPDVKHCMVHVNPKIY